MDRARVLEQALSERRRSHKRSPSADVDEMRGRIGSFAEFQGKVVKSYTKRLKAAAHREESLHEPQVKKLVHAMEQLDSIMADLRSLT